MHGPTCTFLAILTPFSLQSISLFNSAKKMDLLESYQGGQLAKADFDHEVRPLARPKLSTWSNTRWPSSMSVPEAEGAPRCSPPGRGVRAVPPAGRGGGGRSRGWGGGGRPPAHLRRRRWPAEAAGGRAADGVSFSIWLENIYEDALRPEKVWSAERLNRPTVIERAHHPATGARAVRRGARAGRGVVGRGERGVRRPDCRQD
jgi:hypothetical protein